MGLYSTSTGLFLLLNSLFNREMMTYYSRNFMMHNSTLANITMEQLETVFIQQKMIKTQEGFMLYVEENKFYLLRQAENNQLNDFLIEINLTNISLIEQFIDLVDQIIHHYEQTCTKQHPDTVFLFKFEVNHFYINFYSPINEVMEIVPFLLTLIRFFYFSQYSK